MGNRACLLVCVVDCCWLLPVAAGCCGWPFLILRAASLYLGGTAANQRFLGTKYLCVPEFYRVFGGRAFSVLGIFMTWQDGGRKPPQAGRCSTKTKTRRPPSGRDHRPPVNRCHEKHVRFRHLQQARRELYHSWRARGDLLADKINAKPQNYKNL